MAGLVKDLAGRANTRAVPSATFSIITRFETHQRLSGCQRTSPPELPDAPVALPPPPSDRGHFAGLMKDESMTRPPLPPFDESSASKKVQMAEDGWNSRDPEKVAAAYTPDCQWRNRAEIFQGRDKIVEFLTRKWARELDYRLIKELWAFHGNRIAVRFAYEYHDDSGTWFRAYGNENWEFAPDGLMQRRIASINERPITESQRLLRWGAASRPDGHPGLTDLDL